MRNTNSGVLKKISIAKKVCLYLPRVEGVAVGDWWSRECAIFGLMSLPCAAPHVTLDVANTAKLKDFPQCKHFLFQDTVAVSGKLQLDAVCLWISRMFHVHRKRKLSSRCIVNTYLKVIIIVIYATAQCQWLKLCHAVKQALLKNWGRGCHLNDVI